MLCIGTSPAMARIKLPATIVIKTDSNYFDEKENKFKFEASIFSNCNPLNCPELSGIFIRINQLKPVLYGYTENTMILKGQTDILTIKENWQNLGELNKTTVYKSLPWSREVSVQSALNERLKTNEASYSGSANLQLIVF